MKIPFSTQIAPALVLLSGAMTKEPGDRLRELRIKKGFATAADAARAYGWNENTYKSHENAERGIKPHVARKYASAYGTTAGYILTGEGDGSLRKIETVNGVRLVGVVAAGLFRDSDFHPGEDTTIIPAVSKKGIEVGRQYAVRVDGPSVNLRIPDGMYAICVALDAYPGGAPLGSLVHVVSERDGLVEHTIKELRYTTDGLILTPVSDDPAFQEPVKLEANDHLTVRINGVVIGAYRPL